MCFGLLDMTAEEIYNATPWEIDMRIKGYDERLRLKRILLASFVTVPVYNSGFNRPKKRGVDIKDIIPDDLRNDDVTQSELDKWRVILEEERERGKQWRITRKK